MDTAVPPNLLQRFQAKLAESRFFTFSLLFHVVIVILAGSVVIMKQIVSPPDFAAEGGGGLVADEASAQPPPSEPEMQQQTFTPQTPQVNTPSVTEAIVSNVASPTAFQMTQSMPTLKAP